MDRPDDPTIQGVLYRRIPNTGGKTKWDDDGNPTFGKSNFQDRIEELSMRIAAETTPESTLEGHEGFGIAQITAEKLREICKDKGITICRDPQDPSEGHILVCGKVPDGLAKLIEKASTWVDGYLPTRPEDDIP